MTNTISELDAAAEGIEGEIGVGIHPGFGNLKNGLLLVDGGRAGRIVGAFEIHDAFGDSGLPVGLDIGTKDEEARLCAACEVAAFNLRHIAAIAVVLESVHWNWA